MNMPTFETSRILLRPFTLDDAAALNDVNRDPDVMKYIGPVEDDVERTREYLKKGPLADYQRHGFGRHACIDKRDGRLVGFCGLKYVVDLEDVDIGYRFLPEYWGQGIATETSELLMDFAKNSLNLKRIIGLALPDNTGSISVLKKLGLEYEKEVFYLGDTCVQYAWNKP